MRDGAAVITILGGGPSLSATQVRQAAISKIEGRCRVMAVNDAVYLAWWADWLVASDYKWWSWHQGRVKHFAGEKITVDLLVPDRWVTRKLRFSGREGFDPDPSCCRGDNSGYQAIHCAVHAGAKRILLLGFDMTGSHWFGDHPDGEAPRLAQMLPRFSTLVEPLRARGVEVINCSPGSALTCFPSADLESVL